MTPLAATDKPRFAEFGHYLLLERLAVGGMAEVYLAKRFDPGGEVSDLLAIKRILPRLARDGEFIRMFLDEAKIAGRLHHPSIVRIQELGRIGKSHYLAMDYVWGKDLLAIIRRCRLLGARLSPSFVAYVGARMCEALHAAHTARDRHGEPMNVIHRDVSPQNVLVSFDGIVKLIDFGIAKAQARLSNTQSGLLKGKIGYMSPEQIATGAVDLRSDLFAVGTCMYELLTLRALFARENSFDAMENVRAARAAPIRDLRADVPEALEAILAKALSREPEGRYSTAFDMQRALDDYLASHDPDFDRLAAVTWIRDAFRKELFAEQRHLDALDQIGRPQLSPADPPRLNTATDLEIPAERTVPAAEPWRDTNEHAIVEAEPIRLEDDEDDDAPTEVFFTAGEGSEAPPPGPEPADPGPAALGPAALEPTPLSESDDISWDPAQLNSGMIARLVPEEVRAAEEQARRRQAAREPTSRHVAATADPEEKPKSGGRWLGRVAMGLVLLLVGAGGTFAWLQLTATARVEVRTEPSVGATVLFDGVVQGPAPVALENVEPGRHVVTIIAPGYVDETRELEVSGHSTAHLDVALRSIDDP